MTVVYVYVIAGLLACAAVSIQWLLNSSRKKRVEPDDYLCLYWQLRRLELLSKQLARRNEHISEAAHKLTEAAEKLQAESMKMKASFDNLPAEKQVLLIDQIEYFERSCNDLVSQAKNLESEQAK